MNVMKIWKEGDHSRAACPSCERLVATRFERRPYPLEQPAVVVPDVLVAVCERCGTTVSVPPQSMPRINAVHEREMVRLEARVPKELEDVLIGITAEYAGRLDAFPGALMRYYISQIAKDEDMAGRVSALATSSLAQGRQGDRFHVRLEKSLLDRALSAARSVGIEDKSDLVRGLILAAREDAERPSPQRRAALEALAVAAH